TNPDDPVVDEGDASSPTSSASASPTQTSTDQTTPVAGSEPAPVDAQSVAVPATTEQTPPTAPPPAVVAPAPTPSAVGAPRRARSGTHVVRMKRRTHKSAQHQPSPLTQPTVTAPRSPEVTPV